MRDLIQAAEAQLEGLLRKAFTAAEERGALPAGAAFSAALTRPREAGRGDLASACALAAGELGLPPRRAAELLLAELDLRGSFFASAEDAGPGYLNFRLGESWYAAVLAAAEAEPGTAPAIPPMDEAAFLRAVGADPALRERQDGGNPLYRLRYACARLGTILARESAPALGPEAAAALLSSEAERSLLRGLALLPEAMRLAAEKRDAARLPRCLTEVTDRFYRWYHTAPFRTAEPDLRAARLRLAAAVRRTLACGLAALGLSEDRVS